MDQTRGEGLIPAHAGKTTRGHGGPYRPAAHPRSRGENPTSTPLYLRLAGSSPLTRGKLGPEVAEGRRGGLIPAHAGKTLTGLSAVSRARAHPRSRGENPKHSNPGQQARGSSPLTRGKPNRSMTPVSASTGSSPLTRGKHFLTCAFTAQIDQILETLELAASFGSYLIWVACATDAPQDPVRSIGLVLPSSMGAS